MGSFQPGAVLFDMDGVLLHSEEVWFRLVEEAGRRWRGRPITREEFAPTFGQGTAADVEDFGLRCTPAELDAFYATRFMDYADAVLTDPDAATTLETLRARGHRLAVVTNTVSTLGRSLLERAGLADRVGAVVCADDVARAKPAPDLLLRALELLDASRERAVMIGDSRFDREAAAACGVRFIGRGIDGERRIERLSELPELV